MLALLLLLVPSRGQCMLPGGSCAIGDRRRTTSAELCSSIHQFVHENHLTSLIEAVVSGNAPAQEQEIADSVADWCASNAADFADSDRRRKEAQLDDLRGFKVLLEDILERKRARQVEPELPAESWQQCAGYAYAIKKMITTIDDGTGAFAAAIFAMSSAGTPSEKESACGAVVNSVNAAVENHQLGSVDESGLLDGMASLEDGKVMLRSPSTTETSLLEALGLEIMTFTLAGVVQAGYHLFSLCTSYESQIVVV